MTQSSAQNEHGKKAKKLDQLSARGLAPSFKNSFLDIPGLSLMFSAMLRKHNWYVAVTKF